MTIEDLTTQGKASIHLDGTFEVSQLEAKLSRYYEKKHCLLMSNATTALHSIAMAANVSSNTHVVAPAFGWTGSIAPFLHAGAQITTAPVDDRFCLDPKRVEEHIKQASSLLLSIDTGGNAANGKALKEIAEKHNMLYISDAAQSLGAVRDGRAAGSYADVVVTSFTYGKSIFGGEGAALMTDDFELYKQIVRLTQHPNRQQKVCGIGNYDPFTPLNGRIHPLAAITANAQFDRLMEIVTQRRKARLKVIAVEIQNQGISKFPFPLEETTLFEYFKSAPSRCRLTKPMGFTVVEATPYRIDYQLAKAQMPDSGKEYLHPEVEVFQFDD